MEVYCRIYIDNHRFVFVCNQLCLRWTQLYQAAIVYQFNSSDSLRQLFQRGWLYRKSGC